MNGLGGVETGSQSYLSGLLGFDDFEKEDYDNATEEDLKQLGIEQADYVNEVDQFLKKERAKPTFGGLLAKLDEQARRYIQQLS